MLMHSQMDTESPARVSPAPDARWDADAPLPSQADVVVIGGGVAGTSTAYQLARRGKQVVLLDMRGICSGASGRNCGMTGGGTPVASRTGQAVYHLSSENLRMIRDELPPVLGSDFDLRLNGVVDIATTEEMWEHHVIGVQLAQEQGGDAQLLDHHELASMMPIAAHTVGTCGPLHWSMHSPAAPARMARR
jgi:glycine/D-amino acid oxidase-like deaminating enzyme